MKRIAAFLALMLGLPLIVAPQATATNSLWNAVKTDYEAVTYDSLFSILTPYVSNIERTNIANTLKAELGKQPTEAEINNRVQQIFMQRLGMKAAFDTVKTDLAAKVERIVANSSVTEAELKANAKQIIFGLTYLQRYYSFKVTENKTAQDLLLFETQTAFGAPARNTPYNIVKQIGGIGYLRAGGAQTAGVYSQIIAPATAPTVSGMINKLVAKYSPQVPVADWFTRTSQALFVEKGEAKFFVKAAADQRLESHLLPLLALSSPSIFVLSTDHSVTYGLTAGYGGATASNLQQRLESTAAQQQNFWDFWHRISTTANKLAEGDITIVTDAMLGKPNTPGATFETRWSPKDGAGVDSGVREFMLPLGLYRDYQRFAGEASTASKRVSLIISEALSDDGINTFTHEMTHIFDDVVWFNGHPIRSGIGGEAYARGFFESLNNTQKAQGGNSSYAPIFNLNTAYQLGAGRVQNASPQRFQTPNDLQQYMRGVFDVIYTLEVMEANSTLKLSAADKALAFNTVSLIPDAKEQNGQKEAFRHLSAAEAGALTTINQLVDNAITSSRIMPQGLDSSAKTLEPNGYYVIPLYQPFYAGLQNNPQAVGDYSFRRHSYELLAEYGWENGLVAYASGKYPHDEAALQAIMPGYNGDMKSFKKAMYAQRAEKIEQLKPAAEFADGAAMQAAMDVAVRSDIARLKSNQSSGASFPTAGVTAIDTLKDRIFRSYLTTTGDFKSSIYREVTTSGVRELWVANGSEGDGSGAGTYDRPYQNLETALARAQAGDVIRLKENVTVAGTGLVFINKAVTIDASVPNAANGEMFTLRFRGRDIQLGANATLKNVNLVFLKDNREPGVIYQAGHELTLDNVNTLVGRLQSGQRPVIYTGVSDETGVIGQKAVLNVVNPNSETRLAKIYVGDLFQDSNIPAEINLAAKNIKIDGGIVLGSENDTVQLAAVKIQSKSDFLNTVTAVPAGNGIANREIIFDGVNLAQVSLSGVHNVTLKNNSRVKLASSQGVGIPGTVTVSAGNTFDVQDNQVQFGHLAGAGTVRIGSAGKVAVAKGISTTAQFIVYRNDATWEPLLGREYISAGNLASSLRVSLEPVAAGF
ncbi:MAG: ZmpA/ZmpB/ZmpC family metallo-endopeptidase, partial [Arcanobacterium sp.]|nr:ZmpA/ZmpB/ZmpC family metallo-endopeptidase [Arcanobacterium sp.]